MKRFKVLYTTRITQKIKKWQDGLLDYLLTSNNSLIKLYDEDRSFLESKTLNDIEIPNCGDELRIGSYLIQIDSEISINETKTEKSPQISPIINNKFKSKIENNNFKPPSIKKSSSPVLNLIEKQQIIKKEENKNNFVINLTKRDSPRKFNEIIEFFHNNPEISSITSNINKLM